MSNVDRHDIKLETDRLVLRRPTDEDAARVADLIDDYEIAKNLAQAPYPYTIQDAESFLAHVHESWGRDQYNFAITLKSEGDDLIGVCSLRDFSPVQVGIGYWLAKPYWGDGLMSEAAYAIVGLAFERMKAPFVVADHFVNNTASARVLEKCGFCETNKGTLYSFSRGRFMPARFLRLNREDWQQKHKMDAT